MTTAEQLRAAQTWFYGTDSTVDGLPIPDILADAAALLEIDARHPAEDLFPDGVYYRGSVVRERLRAHAAAQARDDKRRPTFLYFGDEARVQLDDCDAAVLVSNGRITCFSQSNTANVEGAQAVVVRADGAVTALPRPLAPDALARFIEIDAADPNPDLVRSNAAWYASELRASGQIVETATVHTADEANALLAVGWTLLGHFHLGRPAHVPETSR